jgi:hypothetical protein
MAIAGYLTRILNSNDNGIFVLAAQAANTMNY